MVVFCVCYLFPIPDVMEARGIHSCVRLECGYNNTCLLDAQQSLPESTLYKVHTSWDSSTLQGFRVPLQLQIGPYRSS